MQDTELKKLASEFVEANFDDLIEDLRVLISHKSVQGTPVAGAPYGQEVRDCLDATLAIGERFGLKTVNCENRIGYVELPGKSQDYVATIAHCDVVPAGNGWTSDPFEMIEKDGYVIGRGTMDDKGPLVLTLYLAKFLKELGEEFKYSFRAIVGCDEETGMSDVDYYLEHHAEPVFCYTPDSNFPLIHGEKGIMEGNFHSIAFRDAKIVDCACGIASNVVPDQAWMLIEDPHRELPTAEGITIERLGKTIKVSAQGKGAHASTPENSINAIERLVTFVLDEQLVSEAESDFLQLVQDLTSDYSGQKLNIDRTDDIFSPLTIIGGKLNWVDGHLVQNFNIRYPKSITAEEISTNLSRQAAQHQAELEVVSNNDTFYMDPDNEAVKLCVAAYNDIFGVNEEPYTIGGGTYARHFKNAISFGPEHLDDVYPDFVGPIHGANEGAEIKRLAEALKVYIVATYKLLKLQY